ncbi:MAG: hypothetical protein WC865_10070 [Bacteroidales bacterium]
MSNPLYPEVRYIHMLPDHNLSFYWTKSLNAAIYQLGFVMHYLEMKEDQTLEKEILIPRNSPPETKLVVGNRIGNTGSKFYLHVRGSGDRDDSYMDLKARWDTNNDGIWESEYDGMYEITITFPSPGRRITTPIRQIKKTSSQVWGKWLISGPPMLIKPVRLMRGISISSASRTRRL